MIGQGLSVGRAAYADELFPSFFSFCFSFICLMPYFLFHGALDISITSHSETCCYYFASWQRSQKKMTESETTNQYEGKEDEK